LKFGFNALPRHAPRARGHTARSRSSLARPTSKRPGPLLA